MVTRSGGAVLCDLAIVCGRPAASLSELPSHDESRSPHLVRCNFCCFVCFERALDQRGEFLGVLQSSNKSVGVCSRWLPWISYDSSVATQVRSGGVGNCWVRHSGRRCRDLQRIHDILPGTNAPSYPVLGTMLLIVAGGGNPDNSPVSRLLSVRPMQWTGRLSYSWYLWHWPFIVLTVIALNTNATLPKTAAALASLGVAAAAFHFVENPIRYARSLRRPAYKTYVVGLAITAGALGIAGGAWLIPSDRTPSSFNELESVADRSFFPKCQIQGAPGGASYCYGGESSSTRTVALVGDSHAPTWFNEVSSVAARDKARDLLVTNPACPFIAVEVRPGAANGQLGNRCSIERASAMSLLAKARPTSVILSEHTGLYMGYILDSSGEVPSQSEQTALWQEAFKSFIHNELASGTKVGVILDNPVLPQSPAECVSQTASISECEPSRTVALAPGRMLGRAELQVLNGLSNVPYFSPDGALCNENGCPLELQGQLMYTDDNHLTDAATKLFSAQVSSLPAPLLDEHH